MLFGSYFHSLDDKNRLLIPSKLLPMLSQKLYLLKGFEGCISVYGENEFNKFIELISSKTYLDKASRDFIRLSLSSVVELEVDNSKRITIPKDTLVKYSISKKVVVVGVIDHLEIWDVDKWNSYQEDKEPSFDDLSEDIKQ